MSTIELKKRLIDKIQELDNTRLLQAASRLLGLETDDIEVYRLSLAQKNAINEAREQIKRGEFFTEEEVDKEIDEWLNE
jgi:predicted transcriptional regulator